MTDFDKIAKMCGSRRFARDLLRYGGQVTTKPWWPIPIDTDIHPERERVIPAHQSSKG